MSQYYEALQREEREAFFAWLQSGQEIDYARQRYRKANILQQAERKRELEEAVNEHDLKFERWLSVSTALDELEIAFSEGSEP